MKAAELRTKTKADLEKTLTELYKQQFELRMAKGNGQMTKPHLLTELKRDIARVKTVLNQQTGE